MTIIYTHEGVKVSAEKVGDEQAFAARFRIVPFTVSASNVFAGLIAAVGG